MKEIDMITSLMKIFFINICVCYISCKTINYKISSYPKMILLILTAIFNSVIYALLVKDVSPISILPVLYVLYSIVFAYITSNRIKNSIVITALSVALTYIIYFFSVMLAGLIIYLLKISDTYTSRSHFILIAINEIILIALLFRRKRFKNGFYFMKNDNKPMGIVSYLIVICIIIMAIFNLIHLYINDTANALLFTFIIFLSINLIIWLRIQITRQYRKNMKERTIEIQKKEIDEQLKIIEDIKKENFRLAKAIHKYNNRLCALELGAKNLIEKSGKTEFADELCCILKETKEISKGFSEETTIIKTKLPVTSITGIDNMFKYMQKEAIKNNINFDLHINEKINSLIEETINKDRLETMIGDHLRNAIIAVNARNNSYKSILTTLGLVDGCYELSIYDTGIEFQIDTLLKLGKEQVTTHKDNGGSGIGFMTTFETLKESKASLIIEEYDPKTTNYTKSVTIRFDDKNEYKIRSYRSEEIKNENKRKRVLIKSI